MAYIEVQLLLQLSTIKVSSRPFSGMRALDGGGITPLASFCVWSGAESGATVWT
jgi:hypothetical protein